MGDKIRRITSQGQMVKGALAAYIAPRLAKDKAIQPGELDALCKSIAPKPYADQIPLIADAAQTVFGSRLAADLDLEDLPDILEALKNNRGEEDDFEEEGFEDEDMGAGEGGELEAVTDEGGEALGEKPKEGLEHEAGEGAGEEAGEHPGVQLMKMLGNYEIPSEDLEQINGLITALAKSEGGSMKEKPKAEPVIPAKPVEKQEEVITKPAMDAALAANSTALRGQFKSLFDASEAVAPILGKIDTLAFDSADAIYKMALDHLEVPTEGVHPSAFKALLAMAADRKSSAPASLVMDSASVDSFEKTYSHIPMQA